MTKEEIDEIDDRFGEHGLETFLLLDAIGGSFENNNFIETENIYDTAGNYLGCGHIMKKFSPVSNLTIYERHLLFKQMYSAIENIANGLRRRAKSNHSEILIDPDKVIKNEPVMSSHGVL